MNHKVYLRKYNSRDGKKYYWKLDFSPKIRNKETGRMIRFLSLNMYTYVKPKSPSEKEWNEATIIALDEYKMEYYIKLKNDDLDFLNSKKEGNDFYEYYLNIAEKKKTSQSNYFKWMLVYKHLKNFSDTMRFKDIDRGLANSFREYLLKRPHKRIKGKTISPNSAASYYTKFLFALKQAHKDGLLKENVAYEVDRIKTEDAKRIFLTHEEVLKLVEIDCRDKVLKRACLFMVYTGMRVSDIEKLTWWEIEHTKEAGYYIRFRHKKTKNQQTLHISDEAHDLLGKKGEAKELVFKGFKRRYHLLEAWVKDAGISKAVGFHTFRHTAATLMLNFGADVFTVMKRLGHKNIKTTMAYVNLMEDKMIEGLI